MLKNIFYPNHQNRYIWLSSIYLLFILYLGKISPITVLFAYFLETIIIGFFNALKMFWSIRFGGHKTGGYFLILFFLFHYGFFVGVQSVFGFSLFEMDSNSIFREPFQVLKNYQIILGLEEMKYAFPAIIFTHLGKFFSDFIKNEKYKKFLPTEIMFKPYVRIFIQQFVVILSFFFMVLGKAGIIAAILLILFRLFIDLFFEAIKENSLLLDTMSKKLANEKVSKEEIKKQLMHFTE
ncbi:DUF6498-containing protein [Polaribacter aquimarinus]|uniref:DUF6498-containing protein n=1 Tax=Polaribacter aquimarinus TaxID=2100726 RepID=UPI0011B29995|nr:DUF6498-containing protein [Polaribacter aquimarinus]